MPPLPTQREPIPSIVMQHVEEAAHLRHVRSTLVRDPQVRLPQLARLDERIAAHLDGIAVAGACGAALARQALERPGAGEMFVAAVGAITDRDQDRLEMLLTVAEALPAGRSGLLSAFGWVSASDLKGITKSLLEADRPWRREVGLASCAMHGVDPGAGFDGARRERGDDAAQSALRARAYRAAGHSGCRDKVEACRAALAGPDERCAFAAAWSAVLLGDRTAGLEALASIAGATRPGAPTQLPALQTVLKLVSPKRAQSLLAALAKQQLPTRALIRGVALAGDPHYVPWLISQMTDPKLARAAGEAFSFITGLDIARGGLEAQDDGRAPGGPTDDPSDADVAADEDDSLPWPDPEKIVAWWQSHGAGFAAGTRYFVGEPPSVAHCLAVLGAGFQRQRFAAAEHLSLLRPGTPLFNAAAPAWRQERLLAQMGT